MKVRSMVNFFFCELELVEKIERPDRFQAKAGGFKMRWIACVNWNDFKAVGSVFIGMKYNMLIPAAREGGEMDYFMIVAVHPSKKHPPAIECAFKRNGEVLGQLIENPAKSMLADIQEYSSRLMKHMESE